MTDTAPYRADDNLIATAVSLVTNGGKVAPQESRRILMGILLDVREITLHNSKRIDQLERSPFALPGKTFWAASVVGFGLVSLVVTAVYTSEVAIPFAKWVSGVLLKLVG